MNSLRTNAYLLPLVISALVLRALIPVGFMPGGAGIMLTATLCNAPAGAPRTETLEIPGVPAPASAQAMHCDFCVAPLMGAAFACQPAHAQSVPAADLSAARIPAPVSRYALQRAQTPRAPPLA